jgi:glutaminyl-tRNA synthetase
MSPGQEVRLRYAYIVKCEKVIKDSAGNIIEVHCSYDRQTRGGNTPDGRKIKGTIHWVSCSQAIIAQARLYEPLFTLRNPEDVPEGVDYKTNINPKSLEIIEQVYCEPSLAVAPAGRRYQFERIGYFFLDSKISSSQKMVFNRIVTLKDTWAKIEKKPVEQ